MNLLERLVVVPVNHLIGDSPWAGERLRQHAGAHVRIQAGGLRISLQIDAAGFLQAGGDASIFPDVCIELPGDFPARAMVDRSSLMSAARLSGAADIAETLAFVFRNLRWDMEGDLASLVGDIPARRLMRSGAALFSAARDGGQRMAENMLEFVTEESGLLASPAEIKAFLGEVDVLRDDLARLDKRLSRLTD
ncbi:hypothetical protein BJN45_17065 [Azonexus hydrophilus]|uniref:Ubiquinone biosynthesis accessory factor UbiJ n=1 Tax=Azonexus hydrophilus TaxID=418702 RepID=A0A1R1HYX3_9RHOO|nr:hypothetical protein [Azonexus hydrophilus]OMG51717.1 hypothetical protein BJN45_17065 [Azonexus hydrophilus]